MLGGICAAFLLSHPANLIFFWSRLRYIFGSQQARSLNMLVVGVDMGKLNVGIEAPPPSLSRSNVNIVVAVCVSELFVTEHHTARSPSQGRTYRTRSGRCCGFRNTNHPCRLSFQSTSARKRSVKVPLYVYVHQACRRLDIAVVEPIRRTLSTSSFVSAPQPSRRAGILKLNSRLAHHRQTAAA